MTPNLGLLTLLGSLITLILAVVFFVDGVRKQVSGNRTAGALLIAGGLVLLLVLLVVR